MSATHPALPHAWDRFDVYLFDIDGTLMHCTDATHYFAFCHTLRQISGKELNLDGVVAHGNTDLGILRDALTRARIPEQQWRPRLAEARACMAEFVEARQGELCADVLPQVRQVLDHLQRQGAKLTVATGNLERIGRLKLESAGLLAYFDFGGWSDAHETRPSVFAAAIARARQLYGEQISLCVVGDTPADVAAAHQNAVPVIAVATGIYSFEQLQAAAPELCVRGLGDLFCPTP